ncbi:MAG: SUF system Fe-S cluster assembly protein [Bryobacterales bacterium]|nr:SUF system Fe-S cluster assembly protein [Bryobacteraceae bacterium]MDW8354211.1 SUF system Fe-S cluster assembly protein [Bryobacterales bacterium]
MPETADKGGTAELEAQVIAALRTCYDPEIPVNIYDLGLVYEVRVNADNSVYVKMTLTAPNCPVAGSLPELVRQRVAAVPGVTEARVELTFDPPWSPNKMSDLVKLQLGLL